MATERSAVGRLSLSAATRKGLLILVFGTAGASLGFWLLLWFPVNLAHQHTGVGVALEILAAHSVLFNIGFAVYLYDCRCRNGVSE